MKKSITFHSKDFLFNNGIVKLYEIVEKQDDIDSQLFSTNLKIAFLEKDEDYIFRNIFTNFIKDEEIVFHTDKYRTYFDEKNEMFVQGKKIDIIGRSSGNDTRNTYLYKTAEELEITEQNIEDAEIEYLLKYPDAQKDLHPSKAYSKAKNGKITLTMNSNIFELQESFYNYMMKSSSLIFNSKIHLFEDGQTGFTDMVSEKKVINRWNALIYIFGSRGKKFFYSNIFLYPNSMNLQLLRDFKKDIKISNRAKEIDGKKTSSNIDFYNQLSNDGITNKHFYISNWEEEFEFKTLLYLFSYFYQLEKRAEKKGKGKKISLKEKIAKHIHNISFTLFKEDGDFKSSLSEYGNSNRVFDFLYQLKERDIFKEFIYLFVNIEMGKTNPKDPNLNGRRFVNSVLKFQNFRKEIYNTSYITLKTDKNFSNSKIFEIIDTYLEFIEEVKEMSIHKQGQIIGKHIGQFSEELGKSGKDLLFNLRNIKRHSQFVEYFRDLHFRILKNGEKAKLSKEFFTTLDEVIANEKNWQTVRDYISIYAIQSFRTKQYAKNSQDKKVSK